jgi:hypothetical protein
MPEVIDELIARANADPCIVWMSTTEFLAARAFFSRHLHRPLPPIFFYGRRVVLTDQFDTDSYIRSIR